MKLALPFSEALALATAEKPLPGIIRSVDCRGEKLHAEIDLNAISARSVALRLAAAAAGSVTLTARFSGYSAGVATFAVTAHAFGLPVHKLLPFLLEPINGAIRDRGLPEGLIRFERGDVDPLVLIDVQKSIELKANGMTVTDLRLVDAVIHAEATMGTLRRV